MEHKKRYLTGDKAQLNEITTDVISDFLWRAWVVVD